MTVFDRLGPLLVYALGALAVLVPLALFLVAHKLGQIVRALWALRSELDQVQKELALSNLNTKTIHESPAKAAPPRVALSAFGR